MKKISAVLFLFAFVLFFAVAPSLSADAPKKGSLEAAHALYKAKCLNCHDGVADPDKPGKTRDEWHVVIKLMHDFGSDLNDTELENLVDYFYTIRKGSEKEPG